MSGALVRQRRSIAMLHGNHFAHCMMFHAALDFQRHRVCLMRANKSEGSAKEEEEEELFLLRPEVGRLLKWELPRCERI